MIILAESYEIILRNETRQGTTPVATTQGINGGGGYLAEPISYTSTDSNGNNKNALASAIVAVNVIKPYVNKALAFGISQVEMQTGSAELQRKLTAYSEIGSTTLGIVGAGLIGGIGGAAVAAVTLAAQTAIETGLNWVSINNRKIIASENMQLAKSRAGMVSNRSRGGLV